GFERGAKKTLANVHKVQRELLIEIDEGGPEFPLLRELAPAGQRYLLVQLRDPFKPLFTKDGPVKTEESAPLSAARQFGSELENIPPIALYIMDKIEKKQPGLFRKMKFYERLFNNQDDLRQMSDDEYADAIEAYRTLLEKASETRVSKTPLQAEYENLKLTGTISKNAKILALIETTDSKGHVVGEGDLIGPRFGFVDEVQSEKIIVIEKSRDYLGNILTRQRTIEFFQKI
nr:pilus assembly protein PilP [Nitrospinota bacterium]